VTRTKDEARALATQVHQKLLSQPSTFTELVKSYSDDRSSSEDGLLGRFTRGELMPEIDNTVFALAPGEVSPVVETEFGFHVFQRTD
jgi:peptidyl-prolyl cis-trans isomerase C